MRWANTKITVRTTEGSKEVPAKCKGNFAIHDFQTDSEKHKHFKTLTHIESGMAIIQTSSIGLLYKATKRLNCLDWQGVENGKTPPNTFDREELRRIQRNFTI